MKFLGIDFSGVKLFQDFGVRAFFGTLIIAPVSFAVCWAVVKAADPVDMLKIVIAGIGPIIGGVIGFYFGTKQQPPANPQ